MLCHLRFYIVLAKKRMVGILIIHWQVNLRKTIFKFKEKKGWAKYHLKETKKGKST